MAGVRTGFLAIALAFSLTPDPLSSERFSVYWNAPLEECASQGVPIPVANFSFKVNENQKDFVVFDEETFGALPYFKHGTAYNGGCSAGWLELCNISHHLAALRGDIEEMIPNTKFAGLAIIDLDLWRPLYHLNWEQKSIYKEQSMRIVLAKEPNLEMKEVERKAAEAFNKAARELLERTMALARSMRPNAKWGFSGYPLCNSDAGNLDQIACSDKFRKYNEELMFFIKMSTALYPSIYLRTQNTEKTFLYLRHVLMEARRVAKSSGIHLPIIPISKFEYTPYDAPQDFYHQEDLCSTIKQSADMSAEGVVFWSPSYRLQERCKGLAPYVLKHLLPTVSSVQQQASDCSIRMCSGKGSCVLKKVPNSCEFTRPLTDYRCQCDPGFTGEGCSQKL